MKCFVSNICSDKELTSDIKSLIPDATMRRRMSNIIKRSVSTAVECMKGTDNIASLDSIITSTGLGLLTDSEKFLKNIVENDEELLNPTPFIQSTFNTVGGQIALLMGNNCYNVTFVNRFHAFEDALMDAMFKMADDNCNNVLVGHFDEVTPTLEVLSKRLGLSDQTMVYDGTFFFHLTSEKTTDSMAMLNVELISKNEYVELRNRMDEFSYMQKFGLHSTDFIVNENTYHRYNSFFPASAPAVFDAVRMACKSHREFVLFHEYPDNCVFVISVVNA